MPARVLAAADVYHALLERRAHRSAYGAQEAARRLTDEAAAGRLDSDAVSAVLATAGHEPPRASASRLGGLTGRELDVLRLLVRVG
jgi:HD-GYP domain-containing protein (c-di-GMP phosphodiesterase class II)